MSVRHGSGGTGPQETSPERLRAAAAISLEDWLDVYERFSPVEVESGNRRSRMPRPDEEPRRGAVLVPVVTDPAGARLIYTVRRGHLNDHAGQISFPGGGREPSDSSLETTALREASEEIDLPPDVVEVVGELEDMYIPPSHYLVRPVVGLVPPDATFTISPDEVEEVFTVSISTLMDPSTLHRETWTHEGTEYHVPFFDVTDESEEAHPDRRYRIWGATAAITAGLLVRLGWSAHPAPRPCRNPRRSLAPYLCIL